MISITMNGNTTAVSTQGPAQETSEYKEANQGYINDLHQLGPRKLSVTLGGEEGVKTEAGTGHQEFSAPEASGLPGILGTIHSPGWGSPIGDMAKVTDDCTIELIPGNPGSRTSIAAAIGMGLLVRDAQGNLIDPRNPQPVHQGLALQQQQQEQQKPPVTEQVEVIAPEYQDSLNEFHKRAGITGTNAYMAEAIQKLIEGKSIKGLASDFAGSINAEPDSVEAYTTELVNSVVDRALLFVEQKTGIDADSLLDYMNNRMSDRYVANFVLGAYLGNPKALDEIVHLYRSKQNVF